MCEDFDNDYDDGGNDSDDEDNLEMLILRMIYICK